MKMTMGKKLGVYEVVSLLGAGGMGEVYRARDTKLNRDVALKVLPEAFAADRERLARFEREARLLASLNHPGIAAIHGLEDSGTTHALVMELVEGPTLAEKIAADAADFTDEKLKIARQIAEALEYAHEKGIIHRDLKPANIKITPGGQVKLLDFGLAKALESPQDPRAKTQDIPGPKNQDPALAEALSQSPTLTMGATQAGVILGTAAYMAPEQARGKVVDRRADIWAFGVVLYEMLTGRLPFQGEDVSDTLARVIREEPDWTAFHAGTPSSVVRLLRRCLAKERKQRLADIADARLEIDEALATPGLEAIPSPGTGSRLGWIMAALAMTAMLAMTLPAIRHLREEPAAAAPEMRLEINTPTTTEPGSFALSPDGRQLVFVASGDGASRLWLRPLAATTAQPLAGTEGAIRPFWSPDGRSIGFFADGKLKRLDLGGGAPQALATAFAGIGAWNADGVILFSKNSLGPLFRVSASGGEAVAATKLEKDNEHRFPHFLPDSRSFIFRAIRYEEAAGVYLGSLDSLETTRLLPMSGWNNPMAGFHEPSGCLIWLHDGMLVTQRLDLSRKKLTGDLVTMAHQAEAVSVSASGLVAYRRVGSSHSQLRWFDRSGKPLGDIHGPSEGSRPLYPRVSPDGRRVAVDLAVEGKRNIWLLVGNDWKHFSFGAAIDSSPLWSPDGSRIAFDSNRTGPFKLYIKPSNGAGNEELLLESLHGALSWSKDGRFILCQMVDSQTASDLWVLPMEGDRKPWPFLKTEYNERQGQFSPDGRWVAYMSDESARNEIYVRPFVDTPAASAATNQSSSRWQVSVTGGIAPLWRPDGKELYFIGPGGQMMAAPIAATSSSFESGTPATLFQTRIWWGGRATSSGRQYDVAPDGRFLINTVVDDAATPITILLNWRPDFKK